ncbi:TPA: hypothetical protein ACG8E7_001431, partial [Enterococcus faecium]
YLRNQILSLHYPPDVHIQQNTNIINLIKAFFSALCNLTQLSKKIKSKKRIYTNGKKTYIIFSLYKRNNECSLLAKKRL